MLFRLDFFFNLSTFEMWPEAYRIMGQFESGRALRAFPTFHYSLFCGLSEVASSGVTLGN